MSRIFYYSVTNIINISVWLTLFITCLNHGKLHTLFLYMTILSFTCSTVYLIMKQIQLVKNISIHILEHRLFKFFYTMSMTVCFGFWLLTLGGEQIMPVTLNNSTKMLFINIYVHGFIGLFMFIDLIIYERKLNEDHYYVDLMILLVISIGYSALITMLTYNHDIIIYPFIKNVSLSASIGIFSVITLIMFNAYQSYHYILRRKQIRETKAEALL